jgi:hypothetical protein
MIADEESEGRMTPEQMERAIEFLLNSQAQLTAAISELTNSVTRVEAQAESDRLEIRGAIENLILANEITRKLSEDVARLEAQNSQRITGQSKEIAALVEQGKETDARLNALINIVERHITSTDAHKGEE